MTNISPKTRLDDLKPARFLKVSDLLERWKVQSITVTISRVTSEPTTPNPKDIDPITKQARIVHEPVMFFNTKTGEEWQAGYLLAAKVDIKSLKTATSAETVAELTGKRVTIEVSEWRGKAVLRISPNKPE